MQLIYTESAIKEIEEYKKSKIHELEKIIISEKYVFGDDVIEITGSDIKKASSAHFKVSRSNPKWAATRTLLVVYAFMGFTLMLAGIFYDELLRLIERPIQFALVTSGIFTSFVSYFLLNRIKYSERNSVVNFEMKEIRGQDIKNNKEKD